jgi:hypothetical protein
MIGCATLSGAESKGRGKVLTTAQGEGEPVEEGSLTPPRGITETPRI